MLVRKIGIMDRLRNISDFSIRHDRNFRGFHGSVSMEPSDFDKGILILGGPGSGKTETAKRLSYAYLKRHTGGAIYISTFSSSETSDELSGIARLLGRKFLNIDSLSVTSDINHESLINSIHDSLLMGALININVDIYKYFDYKYEIFFSKLICELKNRLNDESTYPLFILDKSNFELDTSTITHLKDMSSKIPLIVISQDYLDVDCGVYVLHYLAELQDKIADLLDGVKINHRDVYGLYTGDVVLIDTTCNAAHQARTLQVPNYRD